LWVQQWENAVAAALPAYFAPGMPGSRAFPRMFMLPHAQSYEKPEKYLVGQSNLVEMRHAMEIEPWVRERGFDALGTFNLTVQAHSPDGTHANYENNLVKVQMVLNWLDMLN